MQLKHQLISALAIASSMHVQAAISIGKDMALKHVAWIEGQLVCLERTTIAGRTENPCGHKFSLSNKHTYYLEGCGGGDPWLMNGDGTFNSNCRYAGSAKEDCFVTKEWVCS